METALLAQVRRRFWTWLKIHKVWEVIVVLEGVIQDQDETLRQLQTQLQTQTEALEGLRREVDILMIRFLRGE